MAESQGKTAIPQQMFHFFQILMKKLTIANLHADANKKAAEQLGRLNHILNEKVNRLQRVVDQQKELINFLQDSSNTQNSVSPQFKTFKTIATQTSMPVQFTTKSTQTSSIEESTDRPPSVINTKTIPKTRYQDICNILENPTPAKTTTPSTSQEPPTPLKRKRACDSPILKGNFVYPNRSRQLSECNKSPPSEPATSTHRQDPSPDYSRYDYPHCTENPEYPSYTYSPSPVPIPSLLKISVKVPVDADPKTINWLRQRKGCWNCQSRKHKFKNCPRQ
ncbi:mucin-2-like [Leptopilina boulardi]|uniref:mucin-2-like n=1 Tax=Leptopilina boulardi TaxID=63433 RepID=UPI0021F57CAC|nr:mucin-2-like [Leptopilina boulardi]